jgi:transposase
MRPPIIVRTLSDEERQALEQGLRSADAFVLRRCQILLASARGERAPRIAAYLGIDDQTVLDALHAFNAQGLQSLVKGSSRPKRTRLVFGPEQAQRLRALLHRSPRDFGKPSSVWTLDMAAEVSVAEGIMPRALSRRE